MRQGRSLQELAAELTRQNKAKKDFVVNTPAIAFKSEVQEKENKRRIPVSTLSIPGQGDYSVNDHSHDQLAARLQIPASYYNRLREDYPDILDFNVNQLLQRKPERRMVRTLDGNVRAILSDRYKRIDHYDLAKIVLPEIGDLGGQVASCEVTERRLYVKVIFPNSKYEFQAREGSRKVGEIVTAGFVWSNSEVGMGQQSIQAFAEVLRCTNGMVINEYSSKSRHIGRRVGAGDDGTEEATEIWSDDTRKADDKAIALKVRDSIRAVADEAKFALAVGKMRNATERVIEGDPTKVVELVAKTEAFNDTEKGDVLRHLIEGGDLSQWGLLNSITRTAQDSPSYDRATELEAIGGNLLDVDDTSWKRLLATANK
jgi:hypothetical protein